MKQNLIRFSQRYRVALRNDLKAVNGTTPTAPGALRLGHAAVSLGLEQVELEGIHQQAFATLKSPLDMAAQFKRAEGFFALVMTPYTAARESAPESQRDIRRLSATLNRRTARLAATNRQLQESILRRKEVEQALKTSTAQYARLLKDSLQLQEGLRKLTHHVLRMQESDRQHLSRELQDEITQTLVAINVRLLSLKEEAKVNVKGLKKEITSTQRLVAESARTVLRVARKIGSL